MARGGDETAKSGRCDGRGLGVDKGMEVQKRQTHHLGVPYRLHAMLAVVDECKGRNRTRLHPKSLAQTLRRGEAHPRRTDQPCKRVDFDLLTIETGYEPKTAGAIF